MPESSRLPSSDEDRPRYYSPAADLTARILQHLSTSRGVDNTVAQIAARLEVSRTTCLRVLKTLESHNLVRFNTANSTYRLGVRMITLGARAEQQTDYLATVRPVLKSAAESVGATAVFAQRVGFDRLMIILKYESGAGAAVAASVGRSFHLNEVSYGKWVLAFANEEEREQIVANGLAITGASPPEVKKYLEEVDSIKRSRVLVSQEYIPGVTSISCPYVDVHSRLVGVVSILGISTAMVGDRLANGLEAIRQIATSLGEDLAGAAPER
jgi:IclR family transcriptional regulator, KDG regulon repressor